MHTPIVVLPQRIVDWSEIRSYRNSSGVSSQKSESRIMYTPVRTYAHRIPGESERTVASVQFW